MNRRTVFIGVVTLAILLGVMTLVILTCANGGSKFTVSFVDAETCTGPFPDFDMKERQAFAFENTGSKSGSVVVAEIEDEQGNWVPARYFLGEAEAGRNTHLYLYLPQGSHPRSVRMIVSMKASTVQKAQFALRLLIEKAAGRYSGNRVWIDQMEAPAYEFIVKLNKETEGDSVANGSQSIRSETNQTTSAAVQRR